jgi:hypothetical protein
VTTLSLPTGGTPVKGSRREPAEWVRLGEGMLVAGSASSGGAPSAANRRGPVVLPLGYAAASYKRGGGVMSGSGRARVREARGLGL